MSFSCKNKKLENTSTLAAASACASARDASTVISEQAGELSKQAVKCLGQAQEWAEPRLRDALDTGKDAYARARQETVKFTAPRIVAATEAVRPKVDQAYEAISEDYLPRIQQAMQDAAQAAKSGGTLDEKANRAGQAAQRALTKKPKSKKRRVARTLGWIVVGSAAAGAGYLLWRRTQPIEDPWAEEYWNEAEGTRAGSFAADMMDSPVVDEKPKTEEAAQPVGEKLDAGEK